LLKNESFPNYVLTIPPCRGGRDEATGENGIKIGRRTWPHSPSLSGKVFAHARRRAPRVFFTRMGWPNPNTSWPHPHSWPGYEWRQHDIIVMSSCTVGMPGMTSTWCKCDVSMHSRHAMSADTSSTSQQTRQHSGTHLHIISREPSRVEPSRLEAEPSREPRDRIQCSWSYVQPDLRLNLSRWSAQNCFDQILAVWSMIWTISDLFPANLIVPDAMVRFDHWDLRPKVVVVN